MIEGKAVHTCVCACVCVWVCVCACVCVISMANLEKSFLYNA